MKEEILMFKMIYNSSQYHWIFLTHLNIGENLHSMEIHMSRKGALRFGIYSNSSIQLTVCCIVSLLAYDKEQDLKLHSKYYEGIIRLLRILAH